MQRIQLQPEMVGKMTAFNVVPSSARTPEQFRAITGNDLQTWKKIVARRGHHRRPLSLFLSTFRRITGILSSMRVKVFLERRCGEFIAAAGPKDSATGDLHLTYRSNRNRRVAVLQLIAADRRWPNLYDPKLVELSANTMRFVGAERTGQAWHVQEWICEMVVAV